MITEFLVRLAIALPLVCAAAVASLWALRRGWLRLPALPLRPPAGMQPLEIVAQRSLGPGARVAVIRFDGRDHLLAQSGSGVIVVASSSRPNPESTPCEA